MGAFFDIFLKSSAGVKISDKIRIIDVRYFHFKIKIKFR